MKPKLIFLLAITFAIFFLTGAYAQNSNPVDKQKQEVKDQKSFVRGNFVDQNNDGICDNYQSGKNMGGGRNFVDKNGDGICDHRQDGRPGKAGYGNGFRHRHGHNYCGRGPGYGR